MRKVQLGKLDFKKRENKKKKERKSLNANLGNCGTGMKSCFLTITQVIRNELEEKST